MGRLSTDITNYPSNSAVYNNTDDLTDFPKVKSSIAAGPGPLLGLSLWRDGESASEHTHVAIGPRLQLLVPWAARDMVSPELVIREKERVCK